MNRAGAQWRLSGRRIALWALAAAGQVTLGTVAAQSQERRVVDRPPEELFAALVRDSEVGNPNSEASLDLIAILDGRAEYSHPMRPVLDGLETLALDGATPNVRARAALQLSDAGSREGRQPRAGNVAQLESLYARSSDPGVRAAVISGLSRAAERSKALAFLERVAKRDQREGKDFPGSAIAAMDAIADHEDQGRLVLKRLHDSEAVHEPHARQWLDLIAEGGYGVR